MFNKVLFPTDFSDASKRAIPFIELFGEKFESKLFVLHVMRDIADLYIPLLEEPYIYMRVEEEERKRVQEKMDKLLDELKEKGISAEGAVERGTPVETIIDFAKKQEIDLIIMGSRGLRGLEGALLGSVAKGVSRRSSIPVLTIRKDVASPKIEKILVPTDLSQNSYVAFELACEIALKFDAQIHMLHVLEFPVSESWRVEELMKDEKFGEIMEKVKEEMKEREDVKLIKHVERGFDAGYVITEFADKIGADLIVMATHGRSGLAKVLMGSVTEKVMDTSEVPLLVVKPEEMRI